MRDVQLDTAHFTGFLFGLVLYGTYIVLFSIVIWSTRRPPKRSPHWSIMTILYALFGITTCVVGTWISDTAEAFIKYRDNPGPIAYFEKKNDPATPINVMLDVTATTLADVLFAWRLYNVWGDRRKVMLSATLPFVLIGTATGFTYTAFTIKTAETNSDAYARILRIVNLAATTSSFIFNLLITGLISFRLWYTSYRLPAASLSIHSKQLYVSLAAILIDSGSLYTILSLCFLIVVAADLQGATNLLFYFLPMAVSMVPTLMIARLNMSRAPSPQASERTAVSSMNFQRYTTQPTNLGALSPACSYPMVSLGAAKESDSDVVLAPPKDKSEANSVRTGPLSIHDILFSAKDKSEVNSVKTAHSEHPPSL